MAMNLFSTGTPSRNKNLVEFKAGKMNLKGKMVQPDKRKGLVYVYQSEDSLMHLCWKDRTSGIVEDDLMIFPDDIETKKITQCTTGRVYLMKFKSSAKKFFFWMQETDTEKDEKLWKKLTDNLNNPPAPGSTGSSLSHASGGGAGATERSTSAATAAGLANAFNSEFGNLGGNDLQSLLGSMNEQQLQMFLSGLLPASPSGSSNRSSSSNVSSNQTSRVQSTVSGSRTEPASSTSNTTTAANGVAAAVAAANGTNGANTLTEAKPVVQAEAVTKTTTKAEVTPVTPVSVTNGSNGSNGSNGTAAANGSNGSNGKIQLTDLQSILGNLNDASSQQRSDLDLSDIGFLDVMAPILANKNVQDKLIQYLPESDILPKSEQELKSTLTTPQFKKAMSSFSAALQSGQLGPIMRQFDLPEQVTVAASQGNMEAFAKAMETYAKSKKEKKTSPPADEEDNKMDTK